MSRGIIFVDLAGGERKPFRLDFNAVADLEGMMGKGINALVNEENVGFNTIRAFYWAGLKFKDKGLTLNKAGNLVQELLYEGKEFKELMAPVTEALIAAGIVKRKETDTDNQDEDDEEPAKN
jgi:hypothetical protein